MPYERDPGVLAWFEQALGDERPRVRRAALQLLEHVECQARPLWLARLERDTDPRVATTAVLVNTVVVQQRDRLDLELFESDLADGVGEDLGWEWEYLVHVCRGTWVPAAGVLVWTRDEDDQAARRLALMKTFPDVETETDAVAVITGKRLVNRYTRSARSMAEASLWRKRGRPRYRE